MVITLRDLSKFSQSGRRPHRIDIAFAWGVDDKIQSQFIPAFIAFPEDLAGRLMPTAPAPAPGRSRRLCGFILGSR